MTYTDPEFSFFLFLLQWKCLIEVPGFCPPSLPSKMGGRIFPREEGLGISKSRGLLWDL